MSDAADILKSMGIDPDEAVERDADLSKRQKKDRRICVCGHAVNRHYEIMSGRWACKPSRMDCRCENSRPVLEVEDTRMFLRKTNGPGVEHALSRGMAALYHAGKTAEWIDGPECDACGSSDGPIIPCPISGAKRIAYQETKDNALLCSDCLEKLL